MSDDVCPGFEPQNYLRERCKKCFRLKSKHSQLDPLQPPPSPPPLSTSVPAPTSTSVSVLAPAPDSSSAPTSDPALLSTIPMPLPSTSAMSPTSSTSSRSNQEKRRSWREPPTPETAKSPDYETAESMTDDRSSVVSFKSANSRVLSNARSVESIGSNTDDRCSMVTAASGSLEFDESERAVTPTELFSEYDASQLRLENARLQEQVLRLKAERQRWVLTKPKDKDSNQDESALRVLETKLIEAENLVEEYREENSNLTCKLRKKQEGNKSHRSGQPVKDQLSAAEELCSELMQENKELKQEIQGLQQEVEEMQDQYREEEIEEFRELQRELEMNAKNCRVLQFKLRKSERQREQIQSEKEVLVVRLEERGVKREDIEEIDSDDALSMSNSAPSETILYTPIHSRRELESELRIAKEVSFRLHNELELTEDKRYKLEDEVFYYKEKLRELQTQNKWRESRNRSEQSAKRLSAELTQIGKESLPKELSDVLEREKDLLEQLRFTEKDLQQTRSRMQELETENEDLLSKLNRLANNPVSRGSIGKRAPMTRSVSEGHTQIRLQLATTELESLSVRCEDLERRNNSLTKKMLELEIDTAKRLGALNNGELDKESGFRLNVEIEKDIGRLMARIHDLEKRNSELQIQLRKKITSDASVVRDKTMSVELRNEKQKRKELETELADYKQLIARSENSRLVAMATKVELLTNQLSLAAERATALHKKAVKDSGADESYADGLKSQVDKLERQLSEAKANEVFKLKKQEEKSSQQAMPTADEIEHCCVVLASVEAQTNRLCKQMEKLDNAQKEERRRSLSKDSGASISADLANVMAELKVIHQVLDAHKISYPSLSRRSPVKDLGGPSTPAECNDCKQKVEQIESFKQEIAFYKKKNKELTNQVLQTENRWTVEIEKQTHSYVTQIRGLENELAETKQNLKEQIEIANAHTTTLEERNKAIDEQELRINRLEMELNDRQRNIQHMERELRLSKEWPIKYQKLQHIFDNEKVKFDGERFKIRTETATLKKRTDDAVGELERLRKLWQDEKTGLQKEISALKRAKKAKAESEEEEEVDQSVNSLRSLGPSTSTIRPGVNYRVTRVNDVGVPELKQQLNEQQKKYKELDNKMFQLQAAKEGLEAEMKRLNESYKREKEALNHRARQTEKIRSFELNALQQKFATRINIVENTNKSLQTSLMQCRRERDNYRTQVQSTEKKLEDEQKSMVSERKKAAALTIQNADLEKKAKELAAEINRLRTEIKLSIEAHKADKKLWTIERHNYQRESVPRSSDDDEKDTRHITEKALSAAETVQKQYAEYQKFYTKEVTRLNSKIRELVSDAQTKDTEHRRKVTSLSEQIKILEIDQKNLRQAKEMQMNAREVLQTDQERLMQIVQQAEIQKLTRKYKITAIIDRLATLQEPKEDVELAHIISQLNLMKEEDCQNAFTSSDLDESEVPASDPIGPLNIARPGTSANRSPVFSVFTPNQRSVSIESNATWDGRPLDHSTRSLSPVKKLVNYPDPPPSFLHNVDKLPYYDRNGRLHYVPKSLMSLTGRSLSFDQYGECSKQMKSAATVVEDAEEPSTYPHNRSGSAGTNILYKIRREELAKGTPPSVRTIARAFESLDKPNKSSSKRGFFNIRKSRSVDTNDSPVEKSPRIMVSKDPTALNRNTTSMSQINEDLSNSLAGPSTNQQQISASAYATIIRGGRNPFKNMGSRLVEKVRRSLSRSSQRDRTPEAPLAVDEDISPLDNEQPSVGDAEVKPAKVKIKTKKVTNGAVKTKPTVI